MAEQVPQEPPRDSDLDDWEKTDAIFLMGVNAASNAPRMLTLLAQAHRRGAKIVHINPLKEAASRRTIVPHEFVAMGTFRSTPTGSLDVQVKIGGDLALMRGNLGREGAGPSPVRGHSNVQGNRTCGIDHRPTAAFLDRLAKVCRIDPPTRFGLDTVGVIEAMNSGALKVFVGMGGNFVLAAPDTAYTSAGLRRCDLTVQVSTKLNRSHLVHGRQALILPCLARSEVDCQRTGVQGITVEDSMSMVHISYGMKRPASAQLLSEPAIIAGLAQATLPDSDTPWQHYLDDYDCIRDTMAEVLDGFEAFNRRVRQPLGFRIRQPARELVFHTSTGKAEFGQEPIPDIAKDGSRRTAYGYRAVAYDIPAGNAAGYMPELNALCPAGDFSAGSDQPMMKQLTVEIVSGQVPAPSPAGDLAPEGGD